MRNICQVGKLIPEYYRRGVLILVASCIVGAASTAMPFLIRNLINVISSLESRRIALNLAIKSAAEISILFLAIRIGLVGLNVYLQRSSFLLWTETAATLRQRVISQMLELPLEYFEKARVGEMMERFNAIPSVTAWFFALGEGGLVVILQIIASMLILLVKTPIIGALMMVAIPLNVLYLTLETNKLRPIRRHSNAMVGQMGGVLSELISQITTVRIFTGETSILRRYEESLTNWKQSRAREQLGEVHSSLVSNAAQAFLTVLTFGLVAFGALRGRLSPGDIFLVLLLTQVILASIPQLCRLVYNTAETDVLSERLIGLLSQKTTVANGHLSAVPPLEEVVFDKITFRYPDRELAVLQNVSFSIRKGEMLAIVGPSGSGKSTIAKLLLRLYDPVEGQILWSGHNWQSFELTALRRKISVVSQEIVLFNDTVGNNIRLAQPDASDEEVKAAARAAYADMFIGNLVDGYDTLVGERGVLLSGGERQRIAIARAFLRNPELLILDEATSALDSETESYVQRAIQSLRENRATIVIAHRHRIISTADRTIVIKNGRVAEDAEYLSVLKRGRRGENSRPPTTADS